MKTRKKANLGFIALSLGISSPTLIYSVQVEASQRKALIIANASYPILKTGQNLFRALNSPKYDAVLMQNVLQEHGFQVPDKNIIKDGDKRTITREVKRFVDTLKPDDTAMIYFTGHGVALSTEHGRVNYLLPSKQGFASKADIEHHAVNARWILDSLSEKLPDGRPILVLDACRNSVSSLAPIKGLNQVELIGMEKADALVVYSTKQGYTAYGNKTGPSVFTEYFAKNLRELAHKPISETLWKTRTDVSRESMRRYNVEQIPWEDNGFRGERPFCFSPAGCQPDQSIQIAELQARIKQLEQQQTSTPIAVPTPSKKAHQPLEQFQDRLVSGGKGPVMVSIPGGQFQMGDSQGIGHDDELPVHPVNILPFAMAKYEVTNAQYVMFLNALQKRGTKAKPWFETVEEDSSSHITQTDNTFRVSPGFEKHPVNNVSWYGAKAYVRWLSQQTGKTYRLPTESEWEYAARAGGTKAYSWGNETPVCSLNAENGAVFSKCMTRTRAVDTYQPNGFKLHHMHGNLWEWIADCYKANYKQAPNDGSALACKVTNPHVLRGGSWSLNPGSLRAAYRYGNHPGFRSNDVGFRVVRSDP